MAVENPPPPPPRQPPPPPPSRPDPPARAPEKPLWTKWWVWLVGLLLVAAVVQQNGDENDNGIANGGAQGAADSAGCYAPADAWLDTLHGAFYREFLSAPISDSAYIEYDTEGGIAFYVAVTVEGRSSVAVFGTSDPPLQSDPGLIAASNSSARQLSDLGADISPDSPAGILLLDPIATSIAESCLA